MKMKLTPELSYLIGLWSRSKSKEGLGVEGKKEVLEIFTQQALLHKLAESDKMISDAGKVFFYHGKYRKFFSEIEQDKLERYKYINEYSANYLAGIFDAVGGISEHGMVYIDRFNQSDEMLLFRLGFPTRKMEGRLVIGRPKAFLAFIRNYTLLFSKHPIMDLIKKKKA